MILHKVSYVGVFQYQCNPEVISVTISGATRRGLFRNRRRSVASLMAGSIIDLVPRFLSSRLDEVLLKVEIVLTVFSLLVVSSVA